MWPATIYSFYESGEGLKNQITIMLFEIWPTNRFSKAKSYNFHFHENDVTCPLGANGLLQSSVGGTDSHPLSRMGRIKVLEPRTHLA